MNDIPPQYKRYYAAARVREDTPERTPCANKPYANISESTRASLAGKRHGIVKFTIVLYSQTVQSSLETLRTIKALLPSPNYHLPQFMSPHRLALPERTAFQGKGGGY